MNDYVVFTPDAPNLYSLNQAARLVLAFCDGRSGSALETAYCDALDPMVPRHEASAELRTTIEDLERKCIVRNVRPAKKKASMKHPTSREKKRHGSSKKARA